MADDFEDDVAGLLDDDEEPSTRKRKAKTLVRLSLNYLYNLQV